PAVTAIEGEEIGLFSLMVEHQQLTGENRRSDGTIRVLGHGERPFPLQIAVEVIAHQPVRPEIDVDPFAVGGRRSAGGATNFVDLFNLGWGYRASPQDLACAAIDAQGSELFARPIKIGEENTSIPDDGR